MVHEENNEKDKKMENIKSQTYQIEAKNNQTQKTLHCIRYHGLTDENVLLGKTR